MDFFGKCDSADMVENCEAPMGSLLMGWPRPRAMSPRMKTEAKGRRTAFLLLALLLASAMPIVAPAVADEGRDASITLMISPSSQTVNPGESGEYTVRVYNTGSNPVSVTLSVAQAQTQECGAYSSVIQQIPAPIDAGSYEETTMNVTLGQTAEGSCDTTVTANANEQATPPDVPGQPAQEESTVTTTAGDGSGSVLFGVDLKVSSPNKDWAGETPVLWDVEVENTGRANITVNLEITENQGAGCSNVDDFSISVDPSSINVNSEESEWVEISTEVPDGQSADKFCWTITGKVANDPSQNSSDSEDFSLDVPELHTCEMSMSKSIVRVDPDKEGLITATVRNTGNSAWDVSMVKSGSKANEWLSFDGASSDRLPYGSSSDTKEFSLKVTPDDSVASGQEVEFTVTAKDGGTMACQDTFKVIVGQSHGASISMANGLLSNVEPGTSQEAVATISNDGNGGDSFRVSASSLPDGWSVTFDLTTITLGGKQSADRSGDVTVTVSVPQQALATEEVLIVLSVYPVSGGTAWDETNLRVTVSEMHDMDASSTATKQRGRYQSELQFPIQIDNEGNVDDRFRAVVFKQSPDEWNTHFEDADGVTFTEIIVGARSSATVNLVVRVDGVEDLESVQITVRIINKDDTNSQDEDGDGVPDNQRELIFTATRSDKLYAMDLRLEDGGLDGKSGSVELPPGGEARVGLWVKNTGNASRDVAIFELTGLQGLATRHLEVYGMEVEDKIEVPVGFGVWNLSRGEFVFDSSQKPITGRTYSAAESQMVDNGLIDGHEVRAFELYLELVIKVNPGASTGEGGALQVIAMSENNTANRSGQVTTVLNVRIIEKLSFVTEGLETEADLEFPSKVDFTVVLVNQGNVDTETRIFTSDGMRGWTLDLDDDNGDCEVESGELTCLLKPGEELELTLIVRPPHSAELEDTFTFTLSAEPVETGVVARETVEFSVTGTPPAGFLGIPNLGVLASLSAVLLAFVAVVIRREFE